MFESVVFDIMGVSVNVYFWCISFPLTNKNNSLWPFQKKKEKKKASFLYY